MVVNAARKAYREWRDSPLFAEKRENWKKAEAVIRRHIIQAKKDSWKELCQGDVGQKDQWQPIRQRIPERP